MEKQGLNGIKTDKDRSILLIGQKTKIGLNINLTGLEDTSFDIGEDTYSCDGNVSFIYLDQLTESEQEYILNANEDLNSLAQVNIITNCSLITCHLIDYDSQETTPAIISSKLTGEDMFLSFSFSTGSKIEELGILKINF